MSAKHTVLFCLLFVCPFFLFSQNNNLNFRRLTVDNGLPHTDVTSIAQDANGFVWFGTYAGLSRYDGYAIKTFINRNQQLKRVYVNRINALSLGADGIIWLGTQGGLVAFDPKKEEFLSFDEPQESISKLECDVEGTVYVSFGNRLVAYRLEEKRVLQKVGFDNFDGNITISAFQKDKKGAVWATHTEGVIFLKNQGASCAIVPKKVFDNNQKVQLGLSGLWFSGENTLILGKNKGFIKIDNFKQQQHTQNWVGQAVEIDPSVWNVPKDRNCPIQSFTEDPKSRTIWLSSEYGVAQIADWTTGKIVQKITSKTQPKLISEHVSSVFTDRSGCLWVTSYGGVDILDLNRKPFFSLKRDDKNPQKSLSDDYARALLEDDNGNLWVGTRNEGVNIVNLRTNEWRFLRHQDNSPSTINSNHIRSLTKDRRGRVWIGSDAGIDVVENNQIVQKFKADPKNPNSLTNNVIFSMGVDVFGQVWAGSWDNGVNKIRYLSGQNAQIERFVKSENGLCGSKVSFVFADPKNPEVFVGTTEGLNHIFLNSEGGVSKIYHYKGVEGKTELLNSDFVWPIVRTNAKTLWVGTLGGGLNKLTLLGEGTYTAQHITTAEGLLSNDVESILTDSEGNLWLGGKGLSRLNPETHELVHFDANDGLQSNVFKIGSAYTGRDGTLYFGGINGVTYFKPNDIVRNREAVQPILTDLTVNNQLMEVGQKIENATPLPAPLSTLKTLIINYLQNNFSLHFSTLEFSNPEKCRYRYQLIGFDKNWVEVDAAQRRASYSNLDYGEYTFQLVAANSDGFWNNKPVTLKIRVLPPWWASIWAKLLYLVLCLGLIYGAYSWVVMRRDLHIQRVEERQSEELHQLRLQFFTNISHELRTPLSLITAPIEKLMSNLSLSDDKRMHHYDLIQRNANRLLNLVNELLEFRKVESGTRRLRATQTDLNAFVRSICEEFEEIAERRDIKFEIALDTDDKKILWFDRNVVEKITVNLLSNAFKYNRSAGSVRVEIVDNEEVVFENELKIGADNLKNAENTEGVVFLKISDTGIGLTASELNQIFDRYYRVTESEQDGQMGSGIGLAFVRSLVALQRGSISVYSEKDKGTAFFIGLPKGKTYLKADEILIADETQNLDALTQNPKLNPQNASTTEGGKIGLSEAIKHSLEDVETAILNQNQTFSTLPRLLIVEDNNELRHFLAESFSESYRILTAEDGEKGLQMALDVQPDVIISDIMMPKLDGIELCKAIRDTVEISHIPFILLTAKNSVQSRIDAADVAADAYIAKPFSLRLLQATLRNLLDSRQKLKDRYAESHLYEVHELTTNKRDQEFLGQMMAIIEQNIEDSDFDVEKIGRKMGISRTVLYSKVSAMTGKSVGEFIRKTRIHTAAKILVTEDLPINMVMDRVGIQSASYFSKAFKKEFGKTPTQYLSDFLEEKKQK
jgi:signal transduction histidine kinase/DNA-binding response OmpR family regulator/streptogramin lyase